jgi:hypothetical protein
LTELYQKLEEIVSKNYISNIIYVRHAYSRGVDPVLQGVPDIVIRPKDAQEISEIQDVAINIFLCYEYAVKGRKHKNKIVFVENYVDGDALNRLTANAQDLPNYRKLGQLFETVDVLRCLSIE